MSIIPQHPGPRSLQRYADGGNPGSAVGLHLERCPRCAATVEFLRQVRGAAQRAPEPPLPEGMLERVLAERARGERVILPLPTPRSWRGRAALGGGALLAAGVAALLLLPRPARHTPADDAAYPSALGRLGILPTLAWAAEPGRAGYRPAPEIEPARLRGGEWSYELRESRGGRPLAPAERGVLRAERVVFARRPAWRVSTVWLGHAADMHETTELDSATLRVMHRVADNVGPSRYRVEQWVVGDSLRGTMDSRIRSSHSGIARYLPPGEGPYLAGETTPVLYLQAARLHPGWSARIALLGWGSVTTDLRYPVEFRVTGETNAPQPACRGGCWVIQAAAPRSRPRTLWLRRADGVLVLSRGVHADGSVSEVRLVGERRIPAAAPSQ